MKLASFLVASTLLIGAPLSAQGSIKDTITTPDGRRIRGVEVTGMTAAEVTYTKGDDEERIAADDVASIEWDDPPELFTLAQSEEEKADYENAANHYLEVAATKGLRAPITLQAKFFGARAMLAGATGDAAKAAAAAGALQDYLDAAPDGYYMPRAKLLMARALRLQGKLDEAESALTALENAALTEGWGLGFDARAKFERALTLVDQGNASAARSAFLSAASAVDAALGSGKGDRELRELKNQAIVGEGETYVVEGNYDQALRFFERHTSPPPAGESTNLQAAALAGKGEALFLEAEGGDDVRALREARNALARANVLDTSARTTTAKALYYSGKVLLALGSDHEKDAKSRAMTFFDTVIRYHPTTPWAAKAREEVGR